LVNGAIGIEPDLELLSSESNMGWKGVGLDYPKPGWCSCRGALLSGNGLNCSDSGFLSMCVSIWFSVENYHRLGVCFGSFLAAHREYISVRCVPISAPYTAHFSVSFGENIY
jgi:hypothetical protein